MTYRTYIELSSDCKDRLASFGKIFLNEDEDEIKGYETLLNRMMDRLNDQEMETDIKPTGLHPIERLILNSLFDKRWISIGTVYHKSYLTGDQLRRGIEWLKYKNYIEVDLEKQQIRRIRKP